MDVEIGGNDSGGGGGAPAWMATFADLMSLLLAFFVLLFSFASVDESLYKEVGGSMQDAFGVQSAVQVTDVVLGVNHIAQEFSSGRPDPKILNVVPQENVDTRKLWDSDKLNPGKSEQENPESKVADEERATSKDESDQQEASGQQAEKAEKSQDQLTGQAIGDKRGLTESFGASVSSEQLDMVAQFAAKKSKQLGKELAAEIANGDLSVETEGNKVIIRVAESASFPPGGAESYGQFDQTIGKIANIVKDSPGSVVVEGHTDNIPISNEKFRSNWDLSASRAATVVQGLISGTGLPVDRFQVRGLADSKPVASNESSIGRAKNRRIEIVLEYDEKNLVPPEYQSQIADPQPKTSEQSTDTVSKSDEAPDPNAELYSGFEGSIKGSELEQTAPSSIEEESLVFRDEFFR